MSFSKSFPNACSSLDVNFFLSVSNGFVKNNVGRKPVLYIDLAITYTRPFLPINLPASSLTPSSPFLITHLSIPPRRPPPPEPLPN